MAYLALIRHGESEWNALDLWTGWTDISLTEKGRREARRAAEFLRDIPWDMAFYSGLKRSKETLDEITQVLQIKNLPSLSSHALDERDYGNFDGLNKIEVEEKYGRDLFDKWHRGWDYPLPHGETLKQVYNRAIPYFRSTILPQLISGKNVLVSAHGNSIRALVKYLETIPDAEIPYLEIATGEIYLYRVSSSGKVEDRQIRGKLPA